MGEEHTVPINRTEHGTKDADPMTENLPAPGQPEPLSTRRGRRAAEARLAAQTEDQAPDGDDAAAAAPADAPAEGAWEAVQNTSGWDTSVRDHGQDDGGTAAAPAVSGRRSRAAQGRGETEPAYELREWTEAGSAVQENHGAVGPDTQAELAGAGVGAPGAGASTTESDTNISTEHAAPVEESDSVEETDSVEKTDAAEKTESVQPASGLPSGEELPNEFPNETEPARGAGELEQVPAPEAPTYAWDGPEPATAGMSRIPLLSDLPASVFPAVLPQPPAEPPVNSEELPLVDGSGPADDAFPSGGAAPSEDAAPSGGALPSDAPAASGDAEAPVEDGTARPAAEVAVLPPAPAQMPADLRERTRLAVRGEPNDVRRATFLDTGTAKIPAARGFRGFLASMGLRIAPSSKELAERRDTRAVSQHWPGPRTISVVNGKGGANKTPTTVMLAALFARNGGGPVLAWDNNETRGTLGWRTEQAQHDSTVMDLLPETGLLLSPVAQSAMLARFVHHQTDDKYDVLRSNPNVLASEQKVTQADFDALHEVASKYFRLNIVDSGNDESAERWLRMIDHTDQLVIATTTVEEHAEAGALLLEALQERGGRSAELARGAVVIVSQADRNGTEAQARRVAEAFKVLARAAVTIPYDPALVKGQIRYASLRPATQRAWLKAAAAVAEGL